MSNPLMEKLLGLPEFEVYDFKQNENDMGFFVQVKKRPDVCLSCGCVHPKLTIAKTRSQTIRDLSVQGKRVALIVKRRSYKCAECGQIFAEPLDCIDGKDRITKRLREHIARKASYMPFTSIEEEFQVSDTTIRNAFLELVKQLPTLCTMETPEILGIDEIYLMKDDYHRKRAWGVICNGDEHTVMDILRSNSNQAVSDALSQLRYPRSVKIVTMDMKAGYRTVVRDILPDATIVVDKFHVIKMANEQVDSIRKSCCSTAPRDLKKYRTVFLAREDTLSVKRISIRDEWFDRYPDLAIAYNLKENFFRMYECLNRQEAQHYYELWKKQIPSSEVFNGFRKMCRTFERCEKEIFNYFDYPYTNAFVEGMNNTIRALALQGRGYDFEVLRGKVLLNTERKLVTPKVDFNRMYNIMSVQHIKRNSYPRDYGVPFSAIIKAINEGCF